MPVPHGAEENDIVDDRQGETVARGRVTQDRFVLLMTKGRRLYERACGAAESGDCALNFAVYHQRIGEREVVVRFRQFLIEQAGILRQSDPEGRLPMTESLIRRIGQTLESEEGTDTAATT